MRTSAVADVAHTVTLETFAKSRGQARRELAVVADRGRAPAAETDLDFHWDVQDLAQDCINQGDISNLQLIHPRQRQW